MFGHCLSDEKAIERIATVIRKVCDGQRVLERTWENAQPLRPYASANVVVRCSDQVELSKTRLYDDLPGAHH